MGKPVDYAIGFLLYFTIILHFIKKHIQKKTIQKTAQTVLEKYAEVGRTHWPLVFLIVISCINAYLLAAIFQPGYVRGWDHAAHYVYTLRWSEMFTDGNFRFRLPYYSMGQPLYYYYQPLPHVMTALLHNLLY